MNVLLVAHAFPPVFGGVEIHLWDVSRELAARGHRVHCLVGGVPARERFGAVTVERHPELAVSHLVRARAVLALEAVDESLLGTLAAVARATVRRFRPDVVHLHNAHHFAPEPALAFFRARDRTPLLNTVHDHVGEHLYPAVLHWHWALTIYVSRHMLSSLPGNGTPRSVLWPGIDLRPFTPDGPRDGRLARLEPPVVFHPARLLRWKGVETGLEAFVLLRRKLGRGSLVLCASENVVDDDAEVALLRRELVERARAAGVFERVVFLAFERERIAAAYRASDVVWYPTVDEEPFGLVPLEAMACGAPLVVSDSGGMRETVLAGETGLVVPRARPDALAAAAERLVRDRTLRDRLTGAGRRRSRGFDLGRFAGRLEAIYRSAVERT